MKTPDSWDEKFILDIAASGETDSLEFKGRQEIDITLPNVKDIRRENLSKTLSALANLGGGILILGINDKNKTVDDGGINRNIKNGTKDWLENILPTLVDPPLSKMNVYEVCENTEDSTILPDRAIYLVELKESPLAPHQSSYDHVYYGRVGAKSMPLGHRLVMDIVNRRQFPNLGIQFFYAFVDESDPNWLKSEGQHRVLSVEIENKGPIYANYVNSILYVPKYLLEPAVIRSFLGGYPIELDDGITYIRIIRENVISEVFSNQKNIIGRGAGRYTPILPGRRHSWQISLVDNFFEHSLNFSKTGPKLIWELYADNAPCTKGEVIMKEIHSVQSSRELD